MTIEIEFFADIFQARRRVTGMTLHELLAQAGIYRPRDLAERIGITRQYAHLIWTGQQPLSRKMARRIAEKTGLDPRALLIAEVPMPPDTPRGRPRARPPEPPPAQA
jgi:transcriptional regulator with XRE-family HTH domain